MRSPPLILRRIALVNSVADSTARFKAATLSSLESTASYCLRSSVITRRLASADCACAFSKLARACEINPVVCPPLKIGKVAWMPAVDVTAF